MSARPLIADYLTEALPNYRIYRHAVAPDGVKGIAIAVERTAVESGASQGLWAEDVSVYVMSGSEDIAAAEDALDGALDMVIFALEALPGLSLTRAERASIENYHGYEVRIQIQTTNQKE